ncbi:MAG: REP-associated tyrosine transposase [Acidobacteriota bacterium]|nr:REP-associated tyrosine transposase [Acidobacteriota bacterium]
MSRGNDGITIFRDDSDREIFLRLLAEEIARSRWVLHDYSLMGNHYHLKVETPECTLSTGMQRLLGRYAQRFNRRHQRRGHLFEARFKNVLVEEEAYGLELSRYIALNPVRAHLVERPEDWKWSSYAARVGLVETPKWLTLEPLFGEPGGDREWEQHEYRNFVLSKICEPETLMDNLTEQIFLGTASWIDKIQKLLDEEERSEEHPRAQVHPGRPNLEDVVAAVAKTFDTTPEAITASHGTLERRLLAYLAFEDGLVPLRRIARQLGLTSAGGVSNLVFRVRKELARDSAILSLADACRGHMRRRPPPFLVPPLSPPITARHYHRAASQSRR